MVANSKHTDRIFNLIDRFLITSGAVGFWRNPSSFIPLIDEYFSLVQIRMDNLEEPIRIVFEEKEYTGPFLSYK